MPQVHIMLVFLVQIPQLLIGHRDSTIGQNVFFFATFVSSVIRKFSKLKNFFHPWMKIL